ncbi:MAG: helix-turn-helix domain-containing protein [Anaerolineales bacterium]
MELTPTEHNLLSYLARHKGQAMTYEQFIDRLYGLDAEWSRHDLFVRVSRLRKKLDLIPMSPASS